MESLLSVVTPAVQRHLYEFYDQLRADDEFRWDHDLDAWIGTSHTIVASLLGDRRFSSMRYPIPEAVPDNVRPLVRVFNDSMVWVDDPDHGRLRGLVAKAFTPRAIANVRGRVEAIVDELLARVRPKGRMETVAELAYPLPMTAICEMLGVPVDDRERVKTWCADVAVILGNHQIGLSEEAARRGMTSLAAMLDYLGWLLASQTGQSDSLLQRMVAAAEDGDRLSHDELLANALFLILAGHETTTNLIGNGLLALLQHPPQHRQLREHPDLIGAAVEEFLRFDPPVQRLLRRAREDCVVEGRQVTSGQGVLLVIGAATRDPAAFPSPNVLDFSRQGQRHISFGHGAHYCLGSALARMEAEIVFTQLLAKLPDLRLDDDLDWFPNATARGLKHLEVTFTAA